MNNLEIKSVRKKLKKSQKEFAKMLGVGVRAVQTWESGERNISQSALLLLNMILSKNEHGSYFKSSEAIEVDFTEMNIMHIPLVSKFAYGGYLDNFGDDEYVGELPKIPFINDIENKGEYLCFEVKGDSMDDGSVDSILEGDILLCRNVNQEYWKSRLHIHKWKEFVIIHKERGILVKQIIEHDTASHEITIHSLNDYYKNETLHLKDIQAIFNVVDLRRKRNRR